MSKYNIFQKLKERGFDTCPEDFYRRTDDWESWYDGYVEKFHNYRVFNGMKKVSCQRYSLGMAKKVCEDWANLEMTEKVAITLEGEREQEFLDAVLQDNNFRVKANEMIELTAALGTGAFVPRITDVAINEETGELLGDSGKIKLDYVQMPNIWPLSWENGKATECAFGTKKVNGKDEYLYVQIHRLNEQGNYDIENVLYADNKGSLTEVELTDIEDFANIPAVVHTNSPERQFVLLRMNIVNNIDTTLPLGISIYANAIDNLKACDIAYDAYVNEFVLGKKRIMVKAGALKNFDGEWLFDPNDTAYYAMPEDSDDSTIMNPIDMGLRCEALNKGMQDMLNVLSGKVGFGENHYKYDRGSLATATQIVSENSALFRNLKKHELVLGDVLTELVRILLRMGKTYVDGAINPDVEMSIDFDDSIIEDKGVEFQRDMAMLSAGIINPYEFRMKWMNEDEATAKSALPQMEELVSGEEQPPEGE